MSVAGRGRAISLLISLSLVLAACSGDGGEGASPVSFEGEVSDHGTATVEGGSIEMEADDFYFEPTLVNAEPGTTVDVEVTNEGESAHTFTIDGQDVDIELGPGESATAKVTIPESGNLPFFCRFHPDQGMQGAFETSSD